MKITCSICHKTFSSYLLGKDDAIKQSSDSLSKHLAESHKEEYQRIVTQVIPQIIAGLPWYLLIKMYSTINLDSIAPNSIIFESYLFNKFQEHEQTLFTLLGIPYALQKEDEKENANRKAKMGNKEDGKDAELLEKKEGKEYTN